MDKLGTCLEQIIADMKTTQPKYGSLLRNGLKTHPIPFFGDVEHARVLTVGVNPSATEFNIERNWPDEMTAAGLRERLINYFQHDSVVSHQWFETWEEALKPLNVSYRNGTAAHVDLSPRATKSMGNTDKPLFARMVAQDVQWFFKILPECKSAHMVLIAGTVASSHYMDEFIDCVAYKHNFQLKEPPTPRGKGFGFNRLCSLGTLDIDLPVFFSSVSPSARKVEQKQTLINRIKDHKQTLLELMA